MLKNLLNSDKTSIWETVGKITSDNVHQHICDDIDDLRVSDTWKCAETINNNEIKMQNAITDSIGKYGGELFGKSKSRIKPIQILADRALRVIACASRATAMTDLIRHLYKSRSNTWVSGTLRWQKRYNHSIEKGATRISIDPRNVRNDRSRILYWFKTHQMQNSSNWICLQLLYPELILGLNMIGKIRTRAYWTTERLEKSQLIPNLYKKNGAQQAQDMKVQKIECDNPHEKVRAPMVEEPNTREKNKGNYLRIPKFLEMKYTLPPLNEAATSA
ncbi:hypothetical protein BB561_006063, partial [Smittium simulii]